MNCFAITVLDVLLIFSKFIFVKLLVCKLHCYHFSLRIICVCGVLKVRQISGSLQARN